MASTFDAIFNTLAKEDKLDGTNYSLRSFMVCNILISRDLWGHVIGDDVKPGNVALTAPRRALVAPQPGVSLGNLQ